jgi:hypothetical protein
MFFNFSIEGTDGEDVGDSIMGMAIEEPVSECTFPTFEAVEVALDENVAKSCSFSALVIGGKTFK